MQFGFFRCIILVLNHILIGFNSINSKKHETALLSTAIYSYFKNNQIST